MRPPTEYHDSRRLLIELLRDDADGPVQLPPMSEAERHAYVVMSAMNVVLFNLCYVGQYDAKDTLGGFEKLCRDARSNIYAICDEEEPADASKH